MINFLVPVDFSETSKNAARFAAQLSANVNDVRLILFNVFDTIEAGSDGTPLEDDDDDRKALMILALQSVKTEISSLTSAEIVCEAVEDNHFVDTLEKYVRDNKIQLVIMGITGASRLAQIFMGSNTLNVVRRNFAPVIIVPPDAHFTGVRNLMLITDFKNVEALPIKTVQAVLDLVHPNLQVVNVDSDHYVELTDEYKRERAKLDSMLKPYHPEYSFIRLFDFMEAINQFVEDKKIDMILTFPRSNSFLSNVFKTTYTSKLAYHSHVPILAIHSGD